MNKCFSSTRNIRWLLPLVVYGTAHAHDARTRLQQYIQCIVRRESGSYLADHRANLLTAMAQQDLHFCTRFLKLVKKYTTLVITDYDVPEHVQRLLFHPDCTITSSRSLGNHPTSDSDKSFHIIAVAVPETSLALVQQQVTAYPHALVLPLDIIPSIIDGTIAWDHFKQLMEHHIEVLYTSALIKPNFQVRKQEYLHSLKILHNMGFEPYIAEAEAVPPSFFDAYTQQVVYSQTNDLSLHNKGVNEAVSMLCALKQIPALSDSHVTVVKTTGRYWFNDDTFFRFIEDNPDYYMYARRGPAGVNGDIFTGSFACKGDHFKHLFTSLDFDYMEKNMVCVEWEVGKYLCSLIERNAPVKIMDSLHMTAHINNAAQATHW